MERIQEALARAEKNRVKQADVPSIPGVSIERDKTAAPNSFADSCTDIQYQTTRVIDVDTSVLEKNRLVAGIPGHPLTDAYRILRTRVLHAMNANSWTSLAISSPATGSGKTLTAINLAYSLAREINRTVLLADFDLRYPSIHRYFDYEPEYGIRDYLHDGVPVEKLFFSPAERLVVLPGKEPIHNSSETLRSGQMISFVHDMKTRYPDRLVIFDLPPILAADDALAFSPFCDAMLIIAENGGTKRKDLEVALETLKDVPILGTVLNKSESKFVGY